MAQGDVLDFNTWVTNIGDQLFDMSTDVFKLGIITNSVVPTIGAADPRWGAGGGVDFSINEVTPGGNYPAGGISLSAIITDNWTSSGGTHTFDVDDVSIAQDVANPSGAYWGIIYSDTAIGKPCVAFIELGGPLDLSAGLVTITWHASGVIRIL